MRTRMTLATLTASLLLSTGVSAQQTMGPFTAGQAAGAARTMPPIAPSAIRTISLAGAKRLRLRRAIS